MVIVVMVYFILAVFLLVLSSSVAAKWQHPSKHAERLNGVEGVEDKTHRTDKKHNTMSHHILRKLTRAYGLHGAGVVYGEQLLTEAITKALHKQHQHQWHLSSSNEEKEFYLSCVAYTGASEAKEAFQALNIAWIVTYSSLRDDLICGYIHIHGQDLQQIETHNDLKFTILTPVPNLAKFDVSIPYLQRYFVGFEVDEESAAITMNHPVIDHLTSGKPAGLSVLFRDGLSNEQRGAWIQSWKSTIASATMESYLSAMSEVYPIDVEDSTSVTLSVGTFSKITHPATKLFRGSTSSQSKTRLHRNLWKSMHTELQNLHRQGKSLAEVCHFDEFEYVNNKHGLYLHFPSALQQDVQLQGNAAHHFGLCLTYMSNVIASSKDVAKIAVSVPMQLQNNNARTIVQSGSRSNQEPYYDAGLTGEGNIVGVSDTGIDENHCFFKDSVHGQVKRSSELQPHTDLKYRKVVQYVNYSGSGGDYADGHGSHVCGTIAGYCESQTNDKNIYRGMAPMAKLIFFDIGVNNARHDLVLPGDMGRDLFGPAFQGGARIHSNSWGGGYYFDTFCLETDHFLYNHDDMLIVFAAGNSGNSGMHTILSPALAKNSLAVGCTQNEHTSGQNLDYIAVFSSHGPTFDGRIKPEIVAPGYSIMSAKASSETRVTETCEMEYKAGTSMATPVVAGNAALIRHYFQHPNHWARKCNPIYSFCLKGSFSPSGFLVKGLIMHSGKAVKAYDGRGSTAGFVMLPNAPDVYQGYGRMDLSSILPLQPYNQASFQLFVDEDTVNQLTQRKYTVQVNSSHHPLRVTLTWYDPPNDIFASKFLLHDLDLVLVSPSGVTFYGNSILDQDTPGFGARRDDLNNYEQLTIQTPQVGEWTIMVQCKALTESASQKYALVATMNGVVSKQEETFGVSMLLLQDCVSYGVGSSRFQLGVSKWARVAKAGWGSSDLYIVNSTTTKLTVRGGLHEKVSYAVEELCLPAGCYDLSLQMGVVPAPTQGIQVEFPQCEVYLSPLATKQQVCIDKPMKYNDTIISNTVEIFDRHACRDVCWSLNHYEIQLLLFDEGGSGWSGSHYTIMPDPLSADISSLTSTDTAYGAVSGNLEFSEMESQKKCLRESSTQCYHVHLSFPKGTDDDPELYFLDAQVVEAIPGTTTYQLVNESCPYFLNMSLSYAKFCVGDSMGLPEDYYLLNFYEHAHSLDNLGQSLVSLPSYWNTFYGASKHVKAQCAVHMNHVKLTVPATDSPSVAPSTAPTATQTTSTPSTMPSMVTVEDGTTSNATSTAIPSFEPTNLVTALSFDQMNYSCFSDCMKYPGDEAFTYALNDTCYFLLDIYLLCDSFSIAYGYCPRPECAADCSIDTWCYFAAGTVASCPAFEEYLPWMMNSSSEAIELHQQCSSTLLNLEATSNEFDQKESGGLFWSSTTVAYFIGIAVVIAIFAVIILSQYYRNKQALEGNGGTALYGNLPENSQSAADIELQDYIESSDDGFNVSDREEDKTTLSMKDKLLLKGKEMMNKGKDQLKKQGLIRKGSKHAVDTKKRGEYEMLPLNGKQAVFTIRGEDDDDDEQEEEVQFNPINTFESKPQT